MITTDQNRSQQIETDQADQVNQANQTNSSKSNSTRPLECTEIINELEIVQK